MPRLTHNLGCFIACSCAHHFSPHPTCVCNPGRFPLPGV